MIRVSSVGRIGRISVNIGIGVSNPVFEDIGCIVVGYGGLDIIGHSHRPYLYLVPGIYHPQLCPKKCSDPVQSTMVDHPSSKLVRIRGKNQRPTRPPLLRSHTSQPPLCNKGIGVDPQKGVGEIDPNFGGLIEIEKERASKRLHLYV